MNPAVRLLYVSPVVPARTGSGLAMRARLVLETLARRYDTWLLVVPQHGALDVGLAPEVAGLCRDVAIVPVSVDAAQHAFHRALGVSWSREVQAANLRDGAWPFQSVAFDVVHAYRLTALPHALPYALGSRARPALDVDLDEAESATRLQLARSCESRGNHAAARFATFEARRCAALETAIVAHARRVYVSSASERDALAGAAGGAMVRVVPNAVEVPLPRPPRPIDAAGPFQMLFVGSLGFPANEDAVVHFCEEVLPLVRPRSSRPLMFTIVGAGASPRLVSLAAASDDVTLTGWVDDPANWYARTDVVVVPLRAGRGTKLKVIEAMSHGCAVVSTDVGVDGLDVADGREALIANTPEAFARQCLRLAADPALGIVFGERARAYVLAHHTAAAVAAALDS